MASSGDFFDEDGGKALGAQLLMYAEKVNLDDREGVCANAKLGRDPKDAGDKYTGFCSADAYVPCTFPLGRF